MYKEIVHQRLKEIRKTRGYTQKEVEQVTKINQPTLARIENGILEPNLETLGTLIDFYEVSANWILGTGKNIK